MRTIVAGRCVRLLHVPFLVLLALACNDITPIEPPRVTGPITAPQAQNYNLLLGTATISAPQGWSAAITTLNLARTNFSGAVTLSVENLPTGVWAYFNGSGATDNSRQLQLNVSSSAPTGTFTNVLVRGVASGLADRTALLTLTITEASFTFTLSSSALTIEHGTASTTTAVNVNRNNFTDPVTFAVDTDMHGSMPPGVTAALEPNPVTGNSAVLTVMVNASVVPGVYRLGVWAYTSQMYNDGTLLTLTVSAPAATTSR